MCRHLAYLGPPATLPALLPDPPHGLGPQAGAPRRQCHGTMNVDGFGVGWYADGDPAPARYRRAGPIWADASFADLARVTRTRALLAAVRSATEGTEPGAAAAAPHSSGPRPVSPNGGLGGRAGAGVAGGHRAPPPRPGPPLTCSRWRRGATRRWPGPWCRPACGRAVTRRTPSPTSSAPWPGTRSAAGSTSCSATGR